jgi:stage III sporulation protein SpoIIIAA
MTDVDQTLSPQSPGLEAEEADLLIDRLPTRIQESTREQGISGLIEVVLDLGRVPTARYHQGSEVTLGDEEVTQQEIDQTVAQLSEFGEDNRAGIPRTLHRISAIRNRQNRVVGLTCRVGRGVSGSAAAIRDLVESGHSILLLGPPGVGKTTMLRDVARTLADELNKRVVVVDTSNEIGGDGDIPHPGIGRARRMQVGHPELQHRVMIEAVENHTPEAIVIDEIGTALEAEAARTIAERGVQLIGTAHGVTLSNLMQNPTLSDLIGGIESVTLGDEEARRRQTQKTILERRNPPTFDCLVEIQSFTRVAVNEDVASTVDSLLRGYAAEAEVREIEDGAVRTVRRMPLHPEPEQGEPAPRRSRESDWPEIAPAPGGPAKRILPFGVSRSRLDAAIASTRSAATIVDSVDDADCVLTLRPYYRRRSGPLRRAEERAIPVYVLRNNTTAQMERQLLAMRGDDMELDPVTAALREAEDGVSSLSHGGASNVELAPQNAYIRRLQHEIAQRYGLNSTSRGREPFRRVTMASAAGGAVSASGAAWPPSPDQ